jgi:hypothetical protein
VYRYAIERWKPDPYEFYVLHRGPQDQALKQQYRELEDYAASVDCPSNFVLHSIDVSSEVAARLASNAGLLAGGNGPAAAAFYPGRIDERTLALVSSLPGEQSGPVLVIRYPFNYGIPHHLWSGPFDLAVVHGFLDSPARQELAKRLQDGQTAVWLMIDSGDKAADDASAASLQKTFAKLHKELKLPTLTDDPDDRLLNPEAPKLRIEFSLLRVSRNDPKEEKLIHTLLHMEDGLAEITEPIVFPIYGRGIALPAFAGKGITEAHEELHDVAAFLVGPCSCQVKAQNPGIDLLMSANWGPTQGPKLPGFSEFLAGAMSQAAAPPAEIPEGTTTTVDPPQQSMAGRPQATSLLLRNTIIAVVCGLLLLAVFPLLLRAKKSRS